MPLLADLSCLHSLADVSRNRPQNVFGNRRRCGVCLQGWRRRRWQGRECFEFAGVEPEKLALLTDVDGETTRWRGERHGDHRLLARGAGRPTRGLRPEGSLPHLVDGFRRQRPAQQREVDRPAATVGANPGHEVFRWRAMQLGPTLGAAVHEEPYTRETAHRGAQSDHAPERWRSVREARQQRAQLRRIDRLHEMVVEAGLRGASAIVPLTEAGRRDQNRRSNRQRGA